MQPAPDSTSSIGSATAGPNGGAAGAAAAPVPGAHAQAPAPVDAQWTCQLSALDAKGAAAGDFKEPPTVGTPFLLACEGAPLKLASEKLTLELPPEQKYQLRILQTRGVSDTKAEFVATSWVPGDLKLTNPILTDGAKRLGLGEIHLTVASVIDPKASPPPQPFPPWAPMPLALPAVVWLTILVIALLIVGVVGAWIRVWLRRRSLKRQLESNPIALKPYLHFNKELRRLQREVPGLESSWTPGLAEQLYSELDLALRWYLTREFEISALDRGPKDVMRDLRRVGKVQLDRESIRKVVVALQELDKAKRIAFTSKTAVLGDAHQIIELARVAVDGIENLREKRT